jgi:hypothetical protein
MPHTVDDRTAKRIVKDLLGDYEDQLNPTEYERVSMLKYVDKFTTGERRYLAQLIKRVGR